MKYLLIQSSGGGGHISAMDSIVKEKQITAQRHDFMLEFVPMGEKGVEEWNQAQKAEDIEKLKSLVAKQPLADTALHLKIKHDVYQLLKKENPDEIIDTQAMGTAAICDAVLKYNKKYNKNVKIRKYMTDLPTDKAQHFFHSLGKLTPEQRSVLVLNSPRPLLAPNETSQMFWERHCGPGLNVVELDIKDLPIGAAFKNPEKLDLDAINHNGITIQADFPTQTEYYQLNPKSLKVLKATDKKLTLGIHKDDFVMSIMLGSQGGHALFSYVEQAIELAKENPSDKEKYLFVFCGKDPKIYKEIQKIIQNTPNLPPNLHIMPLKAQTDEEIAPIFSRSNVLITRTGGLATMEVMAAAQGKKNQRIFVHSPAKDMPLDIQAQDTIKQEEYLIEKIPMWEGGNASYLIRKVNNASVVCTSNFKKQISSHMTGKPHEDAQEKQALKLFFSTQGQQGPEGEEEVELEKITPKR